MYFTLEVKNKVVMISNQCEWVWDFLPPILQISEASCKLIFYEMSKVDNEWLKFLKSHFNTEKSENFNIQIYITHNVIVRVKS